MGNALVSGGKGGEEGGSSPQPASHPLLLYPIWVYAVLLVLARIIYLQPWGMASERKRAIQKAQKKRQERFEQIKSRLNSEDGSVVERRLGIVGRSFEQLRDALQQEELTAVEVHEAYMWKALQVQDRLNCLNEVVVESFDWAREMDEKWRGKKEKPPLYGVPFSVKGNFHMKGYDCNLGLGKYVDSPMNDECTFVTHLRYLGGVPFVITTVPQALLSFVCSSAVYGTTANPHDITRGPGGSSGGEGALCAAGGTPFGIGSDLLGSLRIPANMCGLTTLKPTEARFVVHNAHGGVPGRGRLGLGYGFFTKNVKEQVLLLREVLGQPAYTSLVPESARQRLDEAATVEGRMKWRIGYFESDGWLNPVPSVVRAVRETVDKLKEDGHEMVLFKVPDVEKAAAMMFKNAMPDGGKYSRFLYSHDVVDKWMRQFVTLLNLPRWIRVAASYFYQLISPQMGLLARESIGSLEDLRYNQEMTDNYKQEFVEYWKALGIDALVCPSFTVTPVPHQYPSQLAPCALATGLFNLVDFPCGTLPVGRVTKADDEGILDESVFPCGRNPILKLMRDGCKGSEGMPLTVQVVTLPMEEETCLSVMATIEKLSSYDGKLPGEHTSTKSTNRDLQ